MSIDLIDQAVADLEISARLLSRAADALTPTHPVSADATRDSAAEINLRALTLRLASPMLAGKDKSHRELQ